MIEEKVHSNEKKDIIKFLKLPPGLVLKSGPTYGAKYMIILEGVSPKNNAYTIIKMRMSSPMNRNQEPVEWKEPVQRDSIENLFRNGEITLLEEEEFEQFKESLYYEYPNSELELLKRKLKLNRSPSFY